MTPPDLMRAADRLWDAARALDELRGDRKASEWTAEKVHALMRAGRADEPELVLRLARTLERRLDRERAPVAEAEEAEA